VPSVTAPRAQPTALALSPRRRELLEAALHVTADEGLRGLTHRAVDRRAGLPEGTCSAYMRTRQALMEALTDYVATSVAADVDALARELAALDKTGPEDHTQAVAATQRLFEGWLDERERLLARIELSMEASRNEAIATLLGACRTRLVEVVDGILAAQHREHDARRADALVASFDGLLLAAMLKPIRERREFLSQSVMVVLDALAAPAA
jgi:DNA-binding transcriptional regulator YbjK